MIRVFREVTYQSWEEVGNSVESLGLGWVAAERSLVPVEAHSSKQARQSAQKEGVSLVANQ